MDVIKQIEEALDLQDSQTQSGIFATEHYELTKAALSVLQKMASGEDWFDIESAPKDGTPFIAIVEPNPKKWWHYIIHWDVKSSQWYDGCMPLVKSPYKPTHWRHIDQAKHIKMLMEQEMK